MSINAGGGATEERCIPIPRWAGARPVVVGTGRTNFSIAMGMQQTGDRPMVACTQYSGDDLDIRAIHPSQWKTTKRQWMEIRPMAVGTRHMDFGLRAEANPYLKRAQQMGNSLIPASTQWINSDLMVVL